MKNYITRESCRICGSKNLQDILSLGNQAIIGFSKEVKSPIDIPLDLILCNNCYLLQLRHTTNPALLWNEGYGYRSGINQTMRDELAEIVKKARERVKLKDEDIVLDIGSNDGTLLKNYNG